MFIKDTLRVGSDISDIEGKSTAHLWIHPNGCLYARFSYKFAVPGWKPTEEKITDYWGVEWIKLYPANEIPVEDKTWN